MEGARVLIVDDDPEVRGMLSDFLREEGYETEVAEGGREVLSRLDGSRQMPDVLLLDLVMPDVDGYQVLEQLRRNLLQEMPVLIVSAQIPDVQIRRALDSELRDFISKPFELEELLIRLERLIGRSQRLTTADKGCLRVFTLGTLRVYLDDKLLFDESWRNKPAKTIFKLLFTHRGRRYPKDMLTEELWPETDPSAAANRLRVAIHELRKTLRDRSRKDKGASYIAQQEGAYYFDDSTLCWSDAEAFEGFVQEGRTLFSQGQFDDALHAFQRAEALYQGDYLRDDPFFEWSLSPREQLREMHLDMLADASVIHSDQGRYEEAAGFCRKILRAEPWREEVYRRLMECLAGAGRSSEALRVYDECARMLRAELEAAPSRETTELRERIAAQLRYPVAGA